MVLFDFGSYLLILSTSYTVNTGREFLCQTSVERARKETRETDCIMQGCDFHRAQRDVNEMFHTTLQKEIGQG